MVYPLFNMIGKLPLYEIFDIYKTPIKVQEILMFETITKHENPKFDYTDFFSECDFTKNIIILMTSDSKLQSYFNISDRGLIGLNTKHDINLSNCKSTVHNTVNISELFNIKVLCPHNVLCEFIRPHNVSYITDLIGISDITTYSINEEVDHYNLYNAVKFKATISLEEHLKTNNTYTLPKGSMLAEIKFSPIYSINTFNAIPQINKIYCIENNEIYNSIQDYL